MLATKEDCHRSRDSFGGRFCLRCDRRLRIEWVIAREERQREAWITSCCRENACLRLNFCYDGYRDGLSFL